MMFISTGTPTNSWFLPDGSCLSAETVSGSGLRVDDVSSLSLRFRQGVNVVRLVGRDRSNSLKKLLQEYALEPWWRDRIPLFYLEEQLVAVGDLWFVRAGSLDLTKRV